MKRDWTDGYVADLAYSHGYFQELAPAYLRYFLLVNGFVGPSESGPFTYCELGYGQGVSANVHAAANPRCEFWGTDFNPDHALNAQALARDAGLCAHWLDDGFEAFLDTPTPQFDYIVLHGVWSWVSTAGQHAIVEIIRRKLKPGGVVFISYNIQPGWNAERPLRDLLCMYAERECPPDMPTAERIRKALKYADTLRRHGSTFFTDTPAASQALDYMLRQDPASLAHEYFNSSWCLTYFAEVERALQAARLRFACSVHLSDICGEASERIAGSGLQALASGSALRETAADFALNRRFRRDVFVCGARMLSGRQYWDAIDQVEFVPLRRPADVSMTLTTQFGQWALEPSRVEPLLGMLWDAAAPLPFAELRASARLGDHHASSLLDDLSVLVARRDIAPVFKADTASASPVTQQFNSAVTRRARFDGAGAYLASPVATSGVLASRHDLLFGDAWREGAQSTSDLLHAVQPWCAGEAPADLAARADAFMSDVVPLWRKLGLA